MVERVGMEVYFVGQNKLIVRVYVDVSVVVDQRSSGVSPSPTTGPLARRTTKGGTDRTPFRIRC
jgi:hypothetical protein